jgi:hypothetical protein
MIIRLKSFILFNNPFTNKISRGFFINRDVLVFSYASEDGVFDPATKLHTIKGILEL